MATAARKTATKSKKLPILFTVGYEGSEVHEFVNALKENGVTFIADVRKNPVSRKKGFSKNKLAEHLRLKNIGYIHMPGLGVPSEWRKKAKAKLITREKMFKDYVAKVIPKEEPLLDELCAMMKTPGLCLLCYEADAMDCHRRYVADELSRCQKGKIQIINLHVKPTVPKLFPRDSEGERLDL